jgi:hypothetical protein
MSEEERLKQVIEKAKEESKEVNIDAGRTKDEIALLVKGIVKFPPGTKDRWQTIALFVGSKSQKECIKKAQEITQKREMDAEQKREKAKEVQVQQIQIDIEKSKPTMVKVPV